MEKLNEIMDERLKAILNDDMFKCTTRALFKDYSLHYWNEDNMYEIIKANKEKNEADSLKQFNNYDEAMRFFDSLIMGEIVKDLKTI